MYHVTSSSLPDVQIVTSAGLIRGETTSQQKSLHQSSDAREEKIEVGRAQWAYVLGSRIAYSVCGQTKHDRTRDA